MTSRELDVKKHQIQVLIDNSGSIPARIFNSAFCLADISNIYIRHARLRRIFQQLLVFTRFFHCREDLEIIGTYLYKIQLSVSFSDDVVQQKAKAEAIMFPVVVLSSLLQEYNEILDLVGKGMIPGKGCTSSSTTIPGETIDGLQLHPSSDYVLARTSIGLLRCVHLGTERQSHFMNEVVTNGIAKFTVQIFYGRKLSAFFIGAVPSETYQNYKDTVIGTSGVKGCSSLYFDIDDRIALYGPKDKTVSGDPRCVILSGIKVPDASYVAVEVNMNDPRTIAFFVNNVKVQHLIEDIPPSLKIGISFQGLSTPSEGEGFPSFVLVSFERLAQPTPTPSSFSYTTYKCLSETCVYK